MTNVLTGLWNTSLHTLFPRPFLFKFVCDDENSNEVFALIRKHCPAITGAETATQTRWLPSGHLQTVFTRLSNWTNVDEVLYKRKVFMTADGGIISMDFAPAHMSEPSESDTTPTMVVLHGLTGGSNETYVRNSVVELSKSREEGGLGFRCVVINYRGCSETMLTSTQLYSAAKVTDLESALLLLTHMFPNSPMLGLGFSLGGAILSRYMGVVGKNTPLIGAISVGAPYTFDKSNEWMESSYVARAYTYVLGSGLYDRVRLSADTLALSPELWRPLELLLRIKIDPDEQKPIAKPEPGSAPHGTVRFFDNTLTRLIGGYPSPYGEFPFSDAWEYYRRGNSVNVVSNVARPMLALTADDDPIVPWHVLPAMVEGVKTNPNVVLAHSESGGHLGWFAGPRGERWIKHPIAQFASAMFDAHAEKAKNSSTLPPTGLGSGGPQLSPWKTRTIVPRPVQVEVLPKSALPHVLPEKERLPVRDNDKDESVSELVWLRTHILTHIPLVHPNDSPACKEPVPPGRMLNLTLVRTCTLTQQHCDSLRPELGFIELPDDVRVCGHNCYVQGHEFLRQMPVQENKP